MYWHVLACVDTCTHLLKETATVLQVPPDLAIWKRTTKWISFKWGMFEIEHADEHTREHIPQHLELNEEFGMSTFGLNRTRLYSYSR